MLPSFVSNMIWGEDSQNAAKQDLVEPELKHTVCEGQDDWMVIECSTEVIGEAVTENESVCSEASEHSWIVEPSPRFRSGGSSSTLSHHSLEDLLIEHPTMSIYASRNGNSNEYNKNTSQDEPDTEKDPKNMQIQLRNQNTQLVLYQNHARQQLAAQLGIPVCPETIQQQQIDASSSKPQKNSKKQSAKQQAYIRVSRGKKAFKIHQCGVKAGRRRC